MLGTCCESSSSFMWDVKLATEEKKENHYRLDGQGVGEESEG